MPQQNPVPAAAFGQNGPGGVFKLIQVDANGNVVTTGVIADLDVPAADSTANVLERDVIGNKTDAGVTAVGTTKSLTAYLKGAITMLTAQTADSTADAFAGDVIGNKTDAVLTAVGTTKSIAAYVKTILQNVGFLADASAYTPGSASAQAYLKGAADLQDNVSQTAAAVMTNGLSLFTIAGGPIEILELLSICVTADGATASTLQYSSSGTLGATTQTISGASASLANAAAGTSVIAQLTALATAPIVNTNGAGISATPGGIIVPAGSLTAVVGVGSTTGTWAHYLRYRPLAKGVTVTNSF
jgi:hypothetical protein